MAGIQYVIDPDAAPLAFSEANGFKVLAPVKSTAAPNEKIWTSNLDTEGELPAGSKRGNSEHTLPLRLVGGDEEEFRLRQVQLDMKINKLDDEGGVLRVIYPDGSYIDWEIRAVNCGEKLVDNRFVHHKRTEGEVTFVCAPFGVEEEELIGEFEGEAKRLIECVVSDIGGSAPALGRAVVTSPEADVWALDHGRESRHYSEAATAKCLYAASALTPLGGATVTTATVEGKAGTSVVRQAALTPNWTAMLSNQLAGVGHMTHEGSYEVIAWIHMPATNAGIVGVNWDYGTGDFLRRTEGDAIYFAADHPREGKVIKLVLSQVFLQEPGQWEGRILAKSSVVGDDLDVLDFGLRPLGEGNGSVSIEPTLNQPSVLLIRDEFNQIAGNLHEKSIAAAGSVSGPRSAGTGTDDASYGAVAWTGAGNVTASDLSRASVSLSSGQSSHYLKATNFSDAIPAGAVVEGILYEVQARGAGSSIFDDRVRAVKGGVVQAADRAGAGAWPLTSGGGPGDPFPYRSYGSSLDLWGATWAYTDLNASNSGIVIAAKKTGIASAEALVDHVRRTVYYADSAGQKWMTSGDAIDLAVETTGHTAQRTEVSDANIATGRYAVAGTTVLADQVVGIKAKRSALIAGSGERIRGGAMGRYVDNNNWLYFGPDVEAPSSPVTDYVRVVKRVAGTETLLDKVVIPDSIDFRSLWLQVDRRGRFFCWGSLIESGIPRLLSAGQDNDLKEGAALDDGKIGFQDAKTGANANTRNFDQFVAWIPPLDAVIYQGLSLELTDRGCRREAQGGGTWADVTAKGDYLKLAPAGLENRKNRLVFIASPNDPHTMGVGFPTKLKVAIYATKRHRTIPDPA